MAKALQGYTQLSEIPKLISKTRTTFLSGVTLPESYRRAQLQQLYQLLVENESDIIQAIQSDMKGRPSNEIAVTEISAVKSEVAHLLNHLSEYMKPKKMPSSAVFLTDSGEIRYTPLGNILLISPWNFPFQLTFNPLAGAIAAGCTVIIKPSEVCSHTSQLMARLVPRYLDENAFAVVLGGVDETTLLLRNKFDLIFFTGGCNVGKIVAKAAAEHLTPCVLELGGKNPVIVDDDCDFEMAAKRIVWGRWCLNAGQICLAPEYVIVNRKSQARLLAALQTTITKYFGDNPQLSDQYARVINQRHFQRLSTVLKQNARHIALGGTTDARENYIAPTVLSNVSMDSPVMQDEVFGPILSIFPVDNVRNDAIPIIQSRPKPLALYIFTNDKTFADTVVSHTDAGGVTINDVVSHFMFPGFPFGGTGHSGMGKYHGWYSFAAFSHEKPVLNKYPGADSSYEMRMPPLTDFKVKMAKLFTEEKPKKWKLPFSVGPWTAAALAGGAFLLKARL
mmetsp:Transcript_38961/g.63703  ORF Transcript_38961/g.63703 Transcript_38961/m.63703 type:complete len:506 (-) Transcript_38961:89-1606(-)|eukprot:CAMPEP_0202729992 /NCGR_PEP_ID=MMETSP1385-20130828/186416_1 /ASSEMBLY_ACC=CAM_ASM_000861 /TAXON_ID=933848 /ORGANISM="Elphidium margaritaceum" /LENGTH=505 /DNA_ID=CAMNT_0049396265 /DNA_START=48 /DNA_END=1565 /DNA_ORIENTATION=+